MNDSTLSLNQERLRKLAGFGSATVHEAQGQAGALSAALKPVDAARGLVGPALTVDARPADNLVIHYAITKAKRGDILVVDAKGFLEAGAWGDILTLAAQKAGIGGLVIDGAVRDAEAIIAMGFPIFARGLSIRGTAKNQPGSVNVPIMCGGVRIEPGDIILGDRDGLVAIPARDIDKVVEASERRIRAEELFRQELNNGKTTIDILHLSDALERFAMR
jgi:4-hydroxy-4-methyl-2-oxoglutarate aldolase